VDSEFTFLWVCQGTDHFGSELLAIMIVAAFTRYSIRFASHTLTTL